MEKLVIICSYTSYFFTRVLVSPTLLTFLFCPYFYLLPANLYADELTNSVNVGTPINTNNYSLVELVKNYEEIQVFSSCYKEGGVGIELEPAEVIVFRANRKIADGCNSEYVWYHLKDTKATGWVRGLRKDGTEGEHTLVTEYHDYHGNTEIDTEVSNVVGRTELERTPSIVEQCLSDLSQPIAPLDRLVEFYWGISDQYELSQHPIPIFDDDYESSCPSLPNSPQKPDKSDYQVLNSAYALAIGQSYPRTDSLIIYQIIPSLGAKKDSQIQIDDSLYVDDWLFPAAPYSYGMLKIALPITTTVENDRLRVVENSRSSKAKILLLASRNAIALLDLDLIDDEWSTTLSDKNILLNLRWAELTESGLFKLNERVFDQFTELSEFATDNDDLRKSLGKSNIFVGLADFISEQELSGVEQILFIKDNWSIRGEGVERFAEALNGAAIGLSFDAISSRTVTLEKGYLQAVLSETNRGRYLESRAGNRIGGPGLSIGETLAAHARALRLDDNSRLTEANDKTRTVFTTHESVAKYAGNLIFNSDLPRLKSLFGHLKCIAHLKQPWYDDPEASEAVISSLHKIGLPEDDHSWIETALYSLIFNNITGFTIPIPSNSHTLASTTGLAPLEIWDLSLKTVGGNPKAANYFARLESEVSEFPVSSEENCGFQFLPNSQLSWSLSEAEVN